MTVNKIGNNVQVVINKDGIKECKDCKVKNEKTSEIKLKKPLNKDTFEKKQPVDKEGKIVNKNGVINN